MAGWVSGYLFLSAVCIIIMPQDGEEEGEGRERGGADMRVDIEELVGNGRWSLLNISLCTYCQ